MPLNYVGDLLLARCILLKGKVLLRFSIMTAVSMPVAQVLKVSLINSMIMKPAKAKLVEQRVLLKQLVNAAQSLLAAPRQHHPPLTLPFLSLGPCKSELQAAAAQVSFLRDSPACFTLALLGALETAQWPGHTFSL